MHILSVIGARPQFIKAAAVSRVITAKQGIIETLVHTGQHYDPNMSDIFFEELSIPHPQYNLEVGSGSHADQTAMMLQRLATVMQAEQPDWVLVYGDTNSTVAGALAATKLHIPVAHVESGLRSFNREMPEEINRIATDHISDLLFVPTITGMSQLAKEGLSEVSVFSGDVMYDTLLYYRNSLKDHSLSMEDLPEKYYVATIHRPANTDNPENLRAIFNALASLPLPVILPLHPRTMKLINREQLNTANVVFLAPLGYLEMLQLMWKAEKVLTDSGGLQKEAYFLGKACITMRDETEWIETLHDGWNTLVGANTCKILQAVQAPLPKVPQKNAFGDGHAAEIIVNTMASWKRIVPS